ncbi:MAG: SH3 domain-containing protein [Pseudomonadota bacterium]
MGRLIGVAGGAAVMLAAWLASVAGGVAAEALGPVTRLPLPRYVSLNAAEVNVRRGPGTEYRRDWLFKRRGLPVRVIDEYGHWRRIEDHEGAGGWVYHALISGRRTAVVVAEGVLLRAQPAGETGLASCAGLSGGEEALACAEAGVVGRLRACEAHWCEIEAEGYRGWVPKAAIWGADAEETFER